MKKEKVPLGKTIKLLPKLEPSIFMKTIIKIKNPLAEPPVFLLMDSLKGSRNLTPLSANADIKSILQVL